MASKKATQKTVYVGLSGGVDSSVTAGLLKEQGYTIVGVYMRQYDNDLGQVDPRIIECAWQQDRRDAIAVAAHLDIPFREWDFRAEYHKDVVDYLVREYKAGRTPNPDVMCNTHIKFGAFLKKALSEGADYIATGHYARTKNGMLYAAKDTEKDQTYFLCGLTSEQLKTCLFPIGDYKKSQVRTLAAKWGLPTAAKKDSQGVCFIGKISMQEFLKAKIKPKKGDLCTPEGAKVGEHEGAAYYTIGQRHGIGFKGGSNSYVVVDKDMKRNIVYVVPLSQEEEHFKTSVEFASVNWLAGAPSLPLKCQARTRYREPLRPCTVLQGANNIFTADFKKGQRAVTPGQMIVFYDGNTVLGSGVIV